MDSEADTADTFVTLSTDLSSSAPRNTDMSDLTLDPEDNPVRPPSGKKVGFAEMTETDTSEDNSNVKRVPHHGLLGRVTSFKEKETDVIETGTRARWALPWRLVLLSIQLLTTYPHVQYARYPTSAHWQLLGLSGHSSTLFFTCILMISNPWKYEGTSWIKGNWLELLSALQPVTQVAMATVAEYRTGDGLATSSTGYTCVYVLVVILLFRRRYRIQRLRLMSSFGLQNLIMTTLPFITFSTVLSLMYLFTESVGCLLENTSYSNACYDITMSNNAFAMVFVVFGFLRIWVIPFSPSIYTPAHIAQFDFSLNEMMQFICFLFGSISGVFLFASSAELEEETFDFYTTKKFPLRRSIKMFSFILLVIAVGVSFLPQKMSNSYIGLKLKALFSTRNPLELGKVYRYISLTFCLLIFFCLDFPFLLFSTRFYFDDDIDYLYRQGKELCMVALLAWPILLVSVNLYFFSRPRGSSIMPKLVYSFLILHPLCLIIGSLLLGDANSSIKHAAAMSVFILNYFATSKGLQHFGAQSPSVISEHLQNYLLKIMGIMAPVVFLFAEGVGCALRFGKLKCETLVDSNLTVSLHLSMSVIFYTSFGYTLKDLSMKNVATLQGASLHTVAQIIFVGFSSFVSFLVFGMRPDIDYIEDLTMEGNKEDLVNERTRIALEICLGTVSGMWCLCYLIQGMKVVFEINEEDHTEYGKERASLTLYGYPSYIYNCIHAGFSKLVFCILGSSRTTDIARLYRFCLLLFVLLPVGLESAYAWTDNAIWEWAAAAQYELCLVSICIYVFCNFGTTAESPRWEAPTSWRWTDVFLCSVPSLILLIGALCKVVKRSRPNWLALFIDDCTRLILISVSMCIVYRAKTVSASVLSDVEKESLVKNRAFWTGISLFFPSVLYVGAELTGCLIRASIVNPLIMFEDIDERCGGLFPGAKAVTLHLTVLYFITAAFAPLEARTINMVKVMTLQLSKFQFLQLSLFFFSCLLALTLYGTRHNGEAKNWQILYLYAFYLSWFANLLLEGSNVLRRRLNKMRGRTSVFSGSGEDSRSHTDSMWGFTRTNRFSTFVGWAPGTDGGVGLMSAHDEKKNPAGFKMQQLTAVKGKEEEEKKHETLGIPQRDMNEWKLVDFANRSHSGRDFIGKNQGKGSFLKSQFKKMTQKKTKDKKRNKDRRGSAMSEQTNETGVSSNGGGGFMNGREEIGNVTGMGGEGGMGMDFSPGYL